MRYLSKQWVENCPFFVFFVFLVRHKWEEKLNTYLSPSTKWYQAPRVHSPGIGTYLARPRRSNEWMAGSATRNVLVSSAFLFCLRQPSRPNKPSTSPPHKRSQRNITDHITQKLHPPSQSITTSHHDHTDNTVENEASKQKGNDDGDGPCDGGSLWGRIVRAGSS